MPVFPGDPPVTVEPHATMAEDGYRVSALACGSHAGTHVDAPSHTEPDGRTIDSFSPDRFVLEAVRVDLRGREPRSRIRVDDLPDANEQSSSSPDSQARQDTDADALVLHTGWDDYWGDPEYFDHPFLAPAAAEYCADRGYDVAIDALSVDPTPTENADPDEPEGVPAHHALLGAGRLIVENLTNLSALPERFELRAYPLKLAGGDGAPVRAVAHY